MRGHDLLMQLPAVRGFWKADTPVLPQRAQRTQRKIEEKLFYRRDFQVLLLSWKVFKKLDKLSQDAKK
jgi:hypothetical protein